MLNNNYNINIYNIKKDLKKNFLSCKMYKINKEKQFELYKLYVN